MSVGQPGAAVPYRNGNGNGASFVPWIAIVLSLGAGFWAVANPKDDVKQARSDSTAEIRLAKQELEGQISALEKTLSHYLTLAQFQAEVDAINRRSERGKEDIQRLYDLSRGPAPALVTFQEAQRQRLDRMDVDINKLRDGLAIFLRRDEEIKDIAAINDKHVALLQAVTELRSSFGSAVTIGDQLKDLRKQIDDLRNHRALDK
jgi:hypothetical protein